MTRATNHIILVLFLTLTAATAAAEDATLNGRPIGRAMSMLADCSLILDERMAASSTSFEPLQQDVPNLGIGPCAYWLRFRLTPTSGLLSMVLQMPHPEIDELDVYRISGAEIAHI
ncbi:MAG TPA: 7TM-DISM domain-containing protein, partial [Flavobacteriales bacterium]|nr:7TM-DISM domain-containing protein [Flavobacteriales bacterium]